MTADEREALAKLIVARDAANDRGGHGAFLAVAAALPPAELKDVTARVARIEAGAGPTGPADSSLPLGRS